MEVLVTIKQLAELKGVNRVSVHRWIKKGQVKAYRSPDNKHWYILIDKPSEIE